MELIEKFEAKLKGKPDALVYSVEVYETPIETSQSTNRVMPLASQHLGPRRYQLSDGRELKWLSDAKFIIVKTGEEIHRI